jgi:hypothetical protein
MATTVFINEIHYDNASTDAGEAVEIAAPAGTDLNGWSLVFYNGANSQVYRTTNLTGIVPDQDDGFGTVSVSLPVNGIQNGAPDGIALVDDSGTVIQFLSYEGSFTASGGPADGQTSTDIGVAETSSTPAGFSLQLAGTGSMAEDFTWQAASDDNFGIPNTGQDFSGGVSGPSFSISDVSQSEGDAGDTVFAFEVTRSGDASASTDVMWSLGNVTTDADDFALAQALSGMVTFAADQTVATLEIAVAGDVEIEPSETFEVTLSNPGNGETLLDNTGVGTIVNDDPAFEPGDVLISEIRNGGGSSDEFFEVSGAPGTSLDGLTLVVLSGEFEPGQVDLAVSLDGFAIQDDGLFAFGDAGVPGLDASGSFNPFGSPSTYLLVEGFTGSSGDDLDIDDDGVLDAMPWLTNLDGVSVVDGDGNTDFSYSDDVLGPDGNFVPSHLFRRGDDGEFVAGVFGDQGNDTAGDDNPTAPVAITAIHEIQGASHVSPFVTLDLGNLPDDLDFVFGDDVTTTGIVTAVDDNGFFVQDPTGDGDIATSDAIFVRTVQPPDVEVGDGVAVSGTVAEFFPGDTDSRNLPTTEIVSPIVEVTSTNNDLPTAVVIGSGGRTVR